MLGELLGSIQEFLGLSTGLAIMTVAMTAIIAVALLSGQGMRLGVWLEDVAYRHTRPGV